jgi:hypothetical protein
MACESSRVCVFCFADPQTRGWVEIDTLDADHGDFGSTDGSFGCNLPPNSKK